MTADGLWQMGPPQWSDLGMFLQTFMLLAVDRGLGTCPQLFWSLQHKAVSTFCWITIKNMACIVDAF